MGDSWFDGGWYEHHSHRTSHKSYLSTMTTMRFDGRSILMRVSTIDRLDDPKDDQGDVRKTKLVGIPPSYITSRYMVARTDGGLIYDMYLSPDALQVTLHN